MIRSPLLDLNIQRMGVELFQTLSVITHTLN